MQLTDCDGRTLERHIASKGSKNISADPLFLAAAS